MRSYKVHISGAGIPNMTNAEAAMQLLLHSVSTTKTAPDGRQLQEPDTEQLRYQLYNVDTDNLASFVKSCKDAKMIANQIRNSMLPPVGNVISAIMDEIIENYLISISAKSSEKGKLINLMASDKTESKIVYAGIPGEESKVRSALRSFGQKHDQQNNPVQGQQGQQPRQ